MRFILPTFAAVLLLGACEPASDGILTLDATGLFKSTVFLDRNGDRLLTSNVDTPVQGAQVALVRSQGDTVARGVTDAAGITRIPGVPVGRYRVVIAGALLGDSLQVVATDSTDVSVTAHDSSRAVVTLGYAQRTIADLRGLPVGRIVSVEGIALHAPNLFGDSTVHIADATGALRLRGTIRGGVVGGDSARYTGRIGVANGLRVLEDPSIVVLGKSAVRAPRDLTTSQAATAQGGSLDAALVRIRNVQIIDASQTALGDNRLRVDDGSGAVDILIDRDARITSEAPLLPGTLVTATGVLVPTEGTSTWQLKPRSTADLVAEVPEISIAAARKAAPGRVVAVRGVALNGSATFGDATVHVADGSGAIRAVGVSSQFVSAGDSVKMVARVGIQEAQPVLLQPTLTILGKGTLPAPVRVNAADASGARGGSLDGALVQLIGVQVDSTSASGPDVLVRVRDERGSVVVFLDANADTWAAAPTKGTSLDVTGLLLPLGDPRDRVWGLKPRSTADLMRR